MDKYDLIIIKSILHLYRDRAEYYRRKGMDLYESNILKWDFTMVLDIELEPFEKGELFTNFFTYKEDFNITCIFELIDYFIKNINEKPNIIELAMLDGIISRYNSSEIDIEHEMNYLNCNNLPILKLKLQEAFNVFLEKEYFEYDNNDECVDDYSESDIFKVYIVSKIREFCFDRIYH
jgi:hypothetical protein